MATCRTCRTRYRSCLRPGLGLSACLLAATVISACAKPAMKTSFLREAPVLAAEAGQGTATARPADPLQAATTYWAEQHEKNPRDGKAALSYAQNLKALGSRERAMEVLDVALRHNPDDAAIASEYGRLALELDQLALARRLLAQAEAGSTKPDWRLLSAQGALHAKLGETDKARRYFMAALKQKPDAASILNNLALSYALDGKPEEAEKLLRRAMARGGDTARVRQNLALVLGLQGRFDEGRHLAKNDLPAAEAESNMAYLRNMVRTPAIAAADAGAQPSSPPVPTPAAVAASPSREPAAASGKATSQPVATQRSPAPSQWTVTVAQEATAQRLRAAPQ